MYVLTTVTIVCKIYISMHFVDITIRSVSCSRTEFERDSRDIPMLFVGRFDNYWLISQY